MAIDIELTLDETMDALRFIHLVRENKKQYEVVDKKFDRNNSSYSVNLMGQLGEMACGKGLGLQVDRSVSPSGDNGHDLSTPLGKNIQVKTSTLDKLIFNATLKMRKKAWNGFTLNTILFMSLPMSIKSIVLIYFNALLLFIKRLRFYPHP